MKKFGKFLLGTISLAAAVSGVYCLYKNRLGRDEDFDDFDDEDDDFDSDIAVDSESREYVSINISGEPKTTAPSEDTSDDTTENISAAEDAPAEDTVTE